MSKRTMSELLLELNRVDNETSSPSQENENEDFNQRENIARPILNKMKTIYNSDFANIIIKDLKKNTFNWKGFYLCKFLRETEEIKAIQPLIDLLKKLNPLSALFDEVMDTLIDFNESASNQLIEEYNNLISRNESFTDLLEIFITTGDPKYKNIVIDAADRLITSEIEFYSNLLVDSKKMDYLPTLKKLRKKYRKLPHIKEVIEYSIDSLAEKNETFSIGVDFLMEKEPYELHKLARKAEENNNFEEAYEIYDYLAHSDYGNFKSLYGKARVGFKLGKFNYEVTRLALEQAIDCKAGSVWINEIRLFKLKLKDKLIQLNDFDESDNYKWMEFICEKCNKTEILRTGKILLIVDEKTNKYKNFYEFEVRCNNCNSTKLKLSKYSQMRLFITAINKNEHPDIIKSLDIVSFEDREIKVNKLHKYIKQKLQKRKNDAVFLLRSANTLKRFNNFDEALELYQASQKMDDTIVSNYYSIIKINAFRFYDFGYLNSQKVGLSFLEKLKSIPESELKYILMREEFDLDDFVEEMEFYLKSIDKENEKKNLLN